MRIVGGRLRGLRLAGVDAPGVRPTTDRVRESLFNILAHDPELRTEAGPCPAGAHVLDVFAGTGALGLEALSRGAARVTFIESDGASLRLLRENIGKARAGDATIVRQADALHPGKAQRPAELILMDPPYQADLAVPALGALAATEWIDGRSLVVVETDRRDDLTLPDGFELARAKEYGRTRLHFIRFLEEGS